MALNWFGTQVTQKMRKAQIMGVNQTMSASVIHAKRNHDWNNRTATLEGSIDIVEPARRVSGKVRGVWGSQDVRYALIHELGGVIKPVRARALSFEIDGQFVTVRQVKIPARPYLRPSADVQYPKLASRIERAFNAPGGGP